LELAQPFYKPTYFVAEAVKVLAFQDPERRSGNIPA